VGGKGDPATEKHWQQKRRRRMMKEKKRGKKVRQYE
jgi:hypothetical protein